MRVLARVCVGVCVSMSVVCVRVAVVVHVYSHACTRADEQRYRMRASACTTKNKLCLWACAMGAATRMHTSLASDVCLLARTPPAHYSVTDTRNRAYTFSCLPMFTSSTPHSYINCAINCAIRCAVNCAIAHVGCALRLACTHTPCHNLCHSIYVSHKLCHCTRGMRPYTRTHT
jgi:hypothetical protein